MLSFFFFFFFSLYLYLYLYNNIYKWCGWEQRITTQAPGSRHSTREVLKLILKFSRYFDNSFTPYSPVYKRVNLIL